MRAIRRIGRVVLVAALLAQASMGKVYVKWTQSAVPSPKALGTNNLVIEWGDQAKGLLEVAKKQSYHIFLEATLEQAQAAAEAGEKENVAGMILRGKASAGSQLEEAASKLRTAHPKWKILVLSPDGKQPEMRGWLVFKRDGILQVSSPTSQPWLDANLAMVRHVQAFESSQAPLYSFSWDVNDPLVRQNGPSMADYSLAVAEAGAYHADLLMEVHERQQKGLASGEKETRAEWNQVKRTIEFYEQGEHEGETAAARVAVLTNDYDASYEALNLMARHNIPYRVMHSVEVKPQDLDGYDVVIAFAALGKDLIGGIDAFAERGGVAVLVNLPGTYPWNSATQTKSNHSVSYVVGKGRVIELGEVVTDPETFAQDVRRLMVSQNIPVSLWNSLTTLVVDYPGEKPGETTVELVNYDEEQTQVQVQVKGTFDSAKFESPERGCCETLKLEHVDGHTEFVVSDLVIGGRVRLHGQAGGTDESTSTKQ